MPLNIERNKSSFKYNLCTTGSVCKRKGQYIVIEAINKCKPDIKEKIHYTIFGSGDDLLHLQKMCELYNLNEHVLFYGNVPNSKMHELLSQQDIFILMSDSEGLPISIIEAMRAGLPIISTKISGIPEQVDTTNGFLINPSIDELVNLLNNIQDYDWSRKGKNSRLRFEKEFSFDNMLKSYCDMMDCVTR